MTQLNPNILQLYTGSANYTVYGIQWIPQSARLVSVGMQSNGSGVLSTWTFDGGKLREQQRVNHSAALKCATFGASLSPARQVATGDHKGELLVYDVARLDTPVYQVKAHTSMIHCVDGVGGKDPGRCGAPELATSSADGYVRLFDPRMKEPVLELTSNAESETRHRVGQDMHVLSKPEAWTVALGGAASHTQRYLAAGWDSGDLKVIDLRAMKICYEKHFANGIVSAEFDRADGVLNKLTLGTLEGHVYTLDISQGFTDPAILDTKPLSDTATVWQVRHSPFNRDLVALVAGSRVGLCRYDYPAQRVLDQKTVAGKLLNVTDAVVSTQTCISLCWSREKNGLLAWSAMDQTVNVGFVTNLKQFD